MMPSTPEQDPDDSWVYAPPETPAPQKARVVTLSNQIDDLVRQKHSLERKHTFEITKLKNELDDLRKDHERTKADCKVKDVELARCKAEGDGMRDELNVYSTIHQQKAILALAQEQMQVIELERRLVQAETARVMRDHKIALFQAKEEELVAELSGKDIQLEELEADLVRANSSVGHQKLAESKSRAELEHKTEKLEGKVEKLESLVKTLKEREKESRDELERWMKDEKSKEGSTDKERRELKTSLRHAQTELQRKITELEDLQQESASERETHKEREVYLKAKLKEANERTRLADLAAEVALPAFSAPAPRTHAAQQAYDDDDDVPALKTKARPASPKKRETAKPKEKARKATPDSDSGASDVESPPKKAKKTTRKSPEKAQPAATKVRQPLNDSAEDNHATERPKAKELDKEKERVKTKPSKAKDVEPEEEVQATAETAQPEKKKKRKLLGAQPTFAWETIMNSGDGLIPGGLSPIVSKRTMGTAGAVPRAGFPAKSVTARSFQKLS